MIMYYLGANEPFESKERFGLGHGLRTHYGYISNSVRPKFKFKSQFQIISWDFRSNLSAQDQKFGIFEKKSLWVSVRKFKAKWYRSFVCFKCILQKPFVTMYGLLNVLKDRLCKYPIFPVMLRYCLYFSLVVCFSCLLHTVSITNVFKDWFIKNRTKHSSSTILSLVRFLMNQSLETMCGVIWTGF